MPHDGDTWCGTRRRSGRESSLDKTLELPAVTFEADALFIPGSDRGALLRRRRLCGVELAVASFDAAGRLMPGNDDAAMRLTKQRPSEG